MKTKVLVGAISGSVISFLLGWVIFGMVMMNVYKNGMTHYEGLMIDPPNLIGIFLGGLAWSTLLAVLFDKLEVGNLTRGAIWGGIIFFLVMLGMDIFFYASMNLYQPMTLAADVIANTVHGTLVGASVGFIMGKMS